MPTCVCGPGKAFTPSPLSCAACEANKYSVTISGPGAGPSACAWCAAGTFSGSGASVCVQCPYGTHRVHASPLGCQPCPMGSYAPDARSSACVACADACPNGLREAPCPTDPGRLLCSPCPQPRANAALNGGRDCASSCLSGFFDRDGECAACTAFDRASCGNGSLHMPCGPYTDARCAPCVNATMPLNYAVWRYEPKSEPKAGSDGPNTACAWECEAGYVARERQGLWECALAGAWWDWFTL
jgi:hypothetical protein